MKEGKAKGAGSGRAAQGNREIFRLTQVSGIYHSGPGTGHIVQNQRCFPSPAEIL